MSRPESVKDISDENRFIRVGSMDLDKFLVSSKLLKHYTALIEEIERQHGELRVSYGNHVEFYLPRSEKELHDQLRTDQYEWDRKQKQWRQAVLRDDMDVPEVPEYARDGVKEWAKAEGLADPWDIFAMSVFAETELDEIRRELGLDN